jgi:hypothetical protein
MKKLVTFASEICLNAMLCCGAAVLLTACGAGTSDINAGQSQTAATVTSSAGQSAANSAATTVPNAADAAGAPAAEAAAAGNFEQSGYESNPLSGAQADASAPEAAAAAPDYQLTTSSPAIGGDTATNAYPTDQDGKLGNASTGYDVGAYQH